MSTSDLSFRAMEKERACKGPKEPGKSPGDPEDDGMLCRRGGLGLGLGAASKLRRGVPCDAGAWTRQGSDQLQNANFG